MFKVIAIFLVLFGCAYALDWEFVDAFGPKDDPATIYIDENGNQYLRIVQEYITPKEKKSQEHVYSVRLGREAEKDYNKPYYARLGREVYSDPRLLNSLKTASLKALKPSEDPTPRRGREL